MIVQTTVTYENREIREAIRLLERHAPVTCTVGRWVCETCGMTHAGREPEACESCGSSSAIVPQHELYPELGGRW